MQTEVLVALVTGIVALLAAVVSGAMARRASPYGELAKRVVQLEQEVNQLKAHDRAHAVVLQSHAAWDARALAALPPETATALGAVPPLYPPETIPGG